MKKKFFEWFDFKFGFKILMALSLFTFFILMFLFLFESGRVELIKQNEQSYYEKMECLAVKDWANIKAALLLSQGKVMLLDGTIGEKPDFTVEMGKEELKKSLQIMRAFREKIVLMVFFHIHSERDKPVGELFFPSRIEASEEQKKYLEEKGIEPYLLDGLSFEKAEKSIFLSKYLILINNSMQLVDEELYSDEVNNSNITLLAEEFDVDLSQNPFAECHEFINSKNPEQKAMRIGQLIK